MSQRNLNPFSRISRITPSAALRTRTGPCSRRLFVDGPEADQRVDLVGERDRDGDRIGRDAVVGALRLVVFLDRRGDRGALPCGARSSGPSGPAVGNSPTISLTRSALKDSRRAPLSGSAPTSGAISRASARCGRRARPACRASRGRRCSARELCEPLVERLDALSRSRAAASDLSSRNLASDSRAATTRSLPATISLPPSLAPMLGTRINRFARLPVAVAQHETLLVGPDGRADTSCGISRNFRRIAHQRDRPFDEAGDFVQQASSSTSSSPCAKARSRASCRMMSLRRAGSSTTFAFRAPAIIVEAAHLMRRARGSDVRR